MRFMYEVKSPTATVRSYRRPKPFTNKGAALNYCKNLRHMGYETEIQTYRLTPLTQKPFQLGMVKGMRLP